MAVALGNGCAVPIISRLLFTTSNTGKLLAVRVILRAMKSVLAEIKTIMLVDSWFMRKTLLLPVLDLGLTVIGQARIDTALFDISKTLNQSKKGRPRIYGDKIGMDRIMALPAKRIEMFVYNKNQWIHYREVVAKAGFLKGRVVKALFCQFENEEGKLSKPRLILCTPGTILKHYAKRWTIEPMFNQLKNNWGMNTLWQHSRQVVSRWMQIVSISYAIPQMLAHLNEDIAKPLMFDTPWRTKDPVTAGRIRLGLQRIFGHFAVRSWWNTKSRIFGPPDYAKSTPDTNKFRKVS